MSKNIIIILAVAIVIILVVLGWWFLNKTNSVNIPNPGSVATKNAATSTTGTIVKSPEKAVTSFSFSGLNPGITGVFDNAKHTITFNVPSDVDITSLAPIISVSDGATISPSSGSIQDFTNPVTYTVTAQNGSTQTYTVIVNTVSPQGPVQGS